jgi:hypothetical protein
LGDAQPDALIASGDSHNFALQTVGHFFSQDFQKYVWYLDGYGCVPPFVAARKK